MSKNVHMNTDASTQKGFTIVELLIVIPMASVILVILMASLFTQYINVLAESARANLRTSGQTLLINLQDELLFTISYGEGLDAELSDSYDPPGGWAHDSIPQTLIINEIALDSTRQDDDRNIIRRRLNNCESSSITSNPVAINNIVYFVQNNANSNYGTLYKRTITPTYSLCSIDSNTGDPCTPESASCLGNIKQTSCIDGQVGNNSCEIVDRVLSENVVSMDIKYFAQNNIETQFPSSANKVEIVLTLGDKIYGKEVTIQTKHTIRKIN